MATGFNNAVIARVAAALYDVQLGNATMSAVLDQVDRVHAGNVGALVQSVFDNDSSLKAMTAAQLATLIVKNVGITGAGVAGAEAAVSQALTAAGAAKYGETVVAILNAYMGLTADATYGSAAKSFNAQISDALAYSATLGTADKVVHSPAALAAVTFNLVAGKFGTADVMRITGGQDVLINMRDSNNQITGLDLDGDGTIEFDGKERSITGRAKDFEVVDAYSRAPLDHTNSTQNFLGDIEYRGESVKGDGVNTNGNIFLGGLGVDKAFSGVGNDFLAGGGIAQGRSGADYLSGDRNADFFFAHFSPLDRTDGGASLEIDGGDTSDDASAGVAQTAQDADWLLLEAADDDETVTVWLNNDNAGAFNSTDSAAVNTTLRAGDGLNDGKGRVLTRAGKSMLIDDIENLDASGNLYGFLNGMDVKIGERALDTRDTAGNTVNYGIGSSAQLRVFGSAAGNIIVGGWDNDYIEGFEGSDLLMGGNLQQLLETVQGAATNLNMAGIVNDGRDELYGGDDGDNIVFEADGGVINGGGGTDTLWLTKYSLGTRTATDMLSDGVLRFDLTSVNLLTEGAANEGGAGYGGSNTSGTADQTNYKVAGVRVTVTEMENIDATGLGAIDYKAAGTNNPELNFTNQQNFKGYNGNLQLLGSQGNNGLYAGDGNDEIHGRGGDDVMQGGKGNDDFYFAIDGHFEVGGPFTGQPNDGVDIIRRKIDANGDDLWDTTATGAVVWGQDFGLDDSASTGASVLRLAIQKAGGNTAGTQLNQVVNFVSEVVTGVKEGNAFTAITLNTPAIKAATTYQGLTDAINAALDATAFGADLQATLQADGFTIFISDAKGRELADQTTEVPGAGVSVNQIANTATQNTFEFGAPAVTLSQDRLIYKAWEDRNDNEGVDDNSFHGSTISLGSDAYAEDLVISFGADGTRIAEDQQYRLTFDNLTTEDRVTITVNGVKYTLQVGRDLDGNMIAGEDTVTTPNQVTIQTNFLARLADFITNSFTDDDTAAGKVVANVVAPTATTITLNQQAYDGEQTVFMRTPTISIENLSGGQSATGTVLNQSQHEVLLFNFDGRDGKLNETNVLFWGAEHVQRANLETAKSAGGALAGTEVSIIDGGVDDLVATVSNVAGWAITNNQATNASAISALNFTAHGDDFLLGGTGIDNITGGTGDDRIIGSVGSPTMADVAIGGTGGERADGGKNLYRVQILGEAQARVYLLNKWEAQNPAQVTALQGSVISSIAPIRDNESGSALVNGPTVNDTVFADTLQFEQETFGSNARFTITLDDFSLVGGVVQLRNDGAGLVSVDADGNGVADSYTRFTNFENIRTVSGSGNAVANDGQGNDTLDVTLLSSATTGANGILYNLTNNNLGAAGGVPGSVMYSANAHANLTRPAATDFESLVIRVDGVENVIGGTGDDLLLIDETEAAKNNSFWGDLVNGTQSDDRIEYQNNFNLTAVADLNGIGGIDATDHDIQSDRAEPTVTIKVDNVRAALGGEDTVTMTGGRVGTTVAVDKLYGVEFITLAGNTAQGSREDDTLDVTAMTAGAIVNYNDGTVRSLDGSLHVTVENLFEVERIWADGNDTVILADSAVMGANEREDSGDDNTAAVNIALATFLDFDTVTTPGSNNARLAFVNQDARQDGAPGVVTGTDARTDDDIEVVINQNQFIFDLSKTGGGNDTDTVDYSMTTDAISVVVELDATKPNQFVLVDADGGTFDGVNSHANADDRIDQLISVERIVAAQGESILDLTASTKGLEIKYNNPVAGDRVAASATTNAYDVNSVRISDLSTASPLSRTFLEHRDASDLNTVGLSNKATATWSRIEGSDNAEVVILNSAHSVDTNTFNLRGGANQVKYNELTKSITLSLNVTDYSATAAAFTTGLVTGTVTFQDGQGAGVESGSFLGGTHTITSYTANNGVASGSLRVAASQDAEDTLKFAGGLGDKLVVLAEVGTVDNQITVKLGSGSAQNSIILTGFELLSDAATNDIYDFGSLLNAVNGLDILDNADPTVIQVGAANDHDTIKVGADALGRDGNDALGGGQQMAAAGEISLAALRDIAWKATTPAQGFDFDVLDVTKVDDASFTTVTGASVVGEFTTDEVIFGKINAVTSALNFESIVLTEATVTENGNTYTLNTTTNTLVAGARSVSLTNLANTLSFGGTVLEQAASPGHLRAATTLNATTGVTINVVGDAEAVNITGGNGNDTINAKGGADFLRGGSGNDTINGGFVAEVREVHSYTLSNPAGGAGETVIINGVTVTEGAATAGDPSATIVANNDADAIGAAFVRVWNATPGNFTVNSASAAPNTITSVTYDALTNVLSFTYGAGMNPADGLLAAVGGTAAASVSAVAVTPFAARIDSVDTYVFEATAALNGNDTLNSVDAGDKLDFRAFLGETGAASEVVQTITFTSGAPHAAIVAATDLVVMANKASLSTADFATAAANGKLVIGDGDKVVIAVTEDSTGAGGTAGNQAWKLYFVENGATAGLDDLTVTLVGTVNSDTELTGAQVGGMIVGVTQP